MQYGIECKLHRNTGTTGSPTWVVDNVMKDVALNISYKEGDSTTRASEGVETAEPTLMGISVEFEIKADQSSTQFQAYETAFFAKSKLDLAVLTGPILTPGSRGIRARFKMFDFSRTEDGEGIVTYKVVLKPCADAVKATWLIVAEEEG